MKSYNIVCQNFISTHARKLIRAARGVRIKHYTSIVATEPMKHVTKPLVTIQTYFDQWEHTRSTSQNATEIFDSKRKLSNGVVPCF